MTGRPEVECLDGGTLSFTLAGAIGEAARLIVIDATELLAPPGIVRVFEDADMDRFLGGNRKRSVHDVGLLDLLAVACLGQLPVRRALIGIQPAVLDWDGAPSPAVAAAIPQACAIAKSLIGRWTA
ncbi:MAG: hydrogenase maturation protease [Pseudomonadota bacterium]